jgi:transcriptional regulator with XRE-family HTH domain
MTFGEYFKKYLRHKEITYSAVADKLNITKGMISIVVNGHAKMPYKLLEKFFETFHVPAEDRAILIGFLDQDRIPEEILNSRSLQKFLPEYILTDEEQKEFDKIAQITALSFGDKEPVGEQKEKLNNALKEVFIECLLQHRRQNETTKKNRRNNRGEGEN